MKKTVPKPKVNKNIFKITIQECEALLSAIYTQVEALKSGPTNPEIKSELKLLKSSERKLRRLLKMN